MANHIKQLLEKWYPQRTDLEWVLATIIETAGSSYRKSGAMMMINSLGQYHGMLSGGCLESDIMRQSRRCWEDGSNRIVEYDMREEEDIAWQLGIGCGGMVKILLQPVTDENDFLQLTHLHASLQQNKHCLYTVNSAGKRPDNSCDTDISTPSEQRISVDGDRMIQYIRAPFHLAIFGGGGDAIPLVNLASQLGWRITLIDPRSGYARQSVFTLASEIIRAPLKELDGQAWLNDVDVSVLMNHNVGLDAEALSLVESSSSRYVAILGPGHRTDRVFEQAGLQRADYNKLISNPAGLRLGGELPESIALSILAEAHAYLESADGNSISGLIR